MKAILFHNPKAGIGSHSAESLKAILRLSGYEVAYCSTKGRSLNSMLKKTPDLFVVAGGDGTVGKVLKGISDRSIPVAILPLGTANNIATSLGISGEPAAMAASWSLKRTTKLAVGRVSAPWGDELFIEAVGFGLMADATDGSIGAGEQGEARLVIGRDAFRRALKTSKARDLKVTIDGKPFEHELLGLELMNIGYAGPGVPFRLAANPGDAILDIAAIGPEHRDDMLSWLGPVHEDKAPPLMARQGREVVVHWKGKPAMRIDDSPVAAPDSKARIVISIDHDMLTILLPKGARRPRYSRAKPAAAPPAGKS